MFSSSSGCNLIHSRTNFFRRAEGNCDLLFIIRSCIFRYLLFQVYDLRYGIHRKCRSLELSISRSPSIGAKRDYYNNWQRYQSKTFYFSSMIKCFKVSKIIPNLKVINMYILCANLTENPSKNLWEYINLSAWWRDPFLACLHPRSPVENSFEQRLPTSNWNFLRGRNCSCATGKTSST